MASPIPDPARNAYPGSVTDQAKLSAGLTPAAAYMRRVVVLYGVCARCGREVINFPVPCCVSPRCCFDRNCKTSEIAVVTWLCAGCYWRYGFCKHPRHWARRLARRLIGWWPS